MRSCRTCRVAMRFIACIEDPAVIGRILTHLDANPESGSVDTSALPGATPA
ncbi:transposase [Thioalkalivibrio paradoxus ARh 1]|uniref:Transposase n=1 Tax=Thioalkalivibrio paradoxus ARh 1 TaxID=713585 RepID=W0DGL7_9GAMM|nr:transposase [Thioalkalivibrio paradoxus ARh 1]